MVLFLGRIDTYLTDNNVIRTHNHLARKRTFNHLPNWSKDWVVFFFELCCEYSSVRCIWLHVIIMSRTSFRVNLHSVVCLNVKELLTCSLLQIWRLLRAVDYFCNKIHLRCLTRFWIHLWYGFIFKRSFREYPLMLELLQYIVSTCYSCEKYSLHKTVKHEKRGSCFVLLLNIWGLRIKSCGTPQYVPTTCLVLILLLLFAFG